MNWLKHSLTRMKTAVYNKISSVARDRAEKNKLSVRSTFAGIEVGNFCVAVSTTGLMALGVVPLSLPVLVCLALALLIVGIVGRYVDAVEDDVERLLKYEEHISKGVDGSSATTPSSDSLQQQSD